MAEARRIGEAQVRAYLSIQSIEAERRDGELVLNVTVLNSGQSPATIGTVFYRVMTQDDKWQTRVLSRPETIYAQGERRLSPCYIVADRDDCESIVIGIRMKVVDVFNHQKTLKFNFAGPAEWGDDDKSDRFSPGQHVAAAIERMTERGQGSFRWPGDDEGEEHA